MKTKRRDHSTIEWIHGKKDNIGVILPFPIQILENWISEKSVLDIINIFWKKEIKKVYMLDICILLSYWWTDKSILAARYNIFTHPKHHSSEYIFDKTDLRTILSFRQPDIDGRHWKENHHVHIRRGIIDPNDNCRIVRPNFNKHVALFGPPINGQYVTKVV